MLAVIRHIEKFGLTETVEKFRLKVRIYENKIHLKYDQIECNMALEEVQDCRGLILERGTWKIMSLSFRKFFNHGEGNAHSIDWNTALILEKLDGSMMQVYYDYFKDKWFAATTGTAEGEGEVNNKSGTTFNELFWQTASKYDAHLADILDKNCTYVFELTSPYNIVVKPHGVSSITLLAIRDNHTLYEKTYGQLQHESQLIGIPLVASFKVSEMSFEHLASILEKMPWSEEGYVVIDANFNRVKIKNPAYCAVHHLKGKTAEHNILTIVKTNEIEEFAATFPERKEELFRLKASYDILVGRLRMIWDELQEALPKNITASEKKRYAMTVFEVCKKHKMEKFSNLFFNLQAGKVESIDRYMYEFDDKTLYKML